MERDSSWARLDIKVISSSPPDVLLLKENFNSVGFKLPNSCKAVHSVSSKTADALRHNEVDLPGKSISDHLIKAVTTFGNPVKIAAKEALDDIISDYNNGPGDD